jgi:hypothetical protein
LSIGEEAGCPRAKKQKTLRHINSEPSVAQLPRLLSTLTAMPLIELSETKIDGAVITLVDLEGRTDSYAVKTPRRPK